MERRRTKPSLFDSAPLLLSEEPATLSCYRSGKDGASARGKMLESVVFKKKKNYNQTTNQTKKISTATLLKEKLGHVILRKKKKKSI